MQPSTPRIEAALSPFYDIVERLKEVLGLAAATTETVIAEIGTDMSPFPTVGHLLSWAGIRSGASTRTPASAAQRGLGREHASCVGAAHKKNSYFHPGAPHFLTTLGGRARTLSTMSALENDPDGICSLRAFGF